MNRTVEGNGVGRVNIEFTVANYEDMVAAKRGDLDKKQVRRLTIKGVVDTGATRFVLPRKVVEELGLPITGKMKVQYADGRKATRPTAEGAYVEILGRHSTFNAVVEPKRDTALLGAIVLEDLDLLVDCERQRLVPRDPRYILSEIE